MSYLNAFFKNNEDLRDQLQTNKKIVLPDAKNKGVTTNYLLRVAKDEEVLTISEEKYKHFRGNLQKPAQKLTYMI